MYPCLAEALPKPFRCKYFLNLIRRECSLSIIYTGGMPDPNLIWLDAQACTFTMYVVGCVW